MKQIFYLFIILLVFLGVGLSYFNPGEITFIYYFDSIVLAKPIFILAFIGVGFLFGLFFTFIVFIKLKRANYKLKKKIDLANKELDNLRIMPIRDHH